MDVALESSLRSHWDARLVSYDEERFPFAEWMLATIEDLGRSVTSLETIHESLEPDEAYLLSKDLCAATRRPDFVAIVRRFVQERIAVEGHLVGPLAIQRFLNVRIMLPNRPQGVFPFHTGLLYGHGPASRSLWLPLTDVRAPEDESASMQIVDIETSRRLLARATAERMGVSEMAAFFGAASHAVSAGPGDVLLFTQENLHGNVVNTTGKTRVSIDFRIAEARFGDRLARKIPGGYFELMQDELQQDRSDDDEPADRSNLIYLNNSTRSTSGVPVHLQRLMVLDYCRDRGIDYHFEYFELEGMDHMPTLAHAVTELDSNILLYSAYALPESEVYRKRIVDEAVQRGLTLHFVNEGLVLRDRDDVARLDRLLRFAGHGDGRA